VLLGITRYSEIALLNIHVQQSCFIYNKRIKKWTNNWSHWRPCKNTKQPVRDSARLLSSAYMIDQATSETFYVTDRFPSHLFSVRLKQISHPEEGGSTFLQNVATFNHYTSQSPEGWLITATTAVKTWNLILCVSCVKCDVQNTTNSNQRQSCLRASHHKDAWENLGEDPEILNLVIRLVRFTFRPLYHWLKCVGPIASLEVT
jgi:hypothetical protein